MLQPPLSRASDLAFLALTCARCYRITERVVSTTRPSRCAYGRAVLTTLKFVEIPRAKGGLE